MIACYTAEGTVLHIGPETVHIFLGTQGRRAFEQRSVGKDILVRQAQIMRTCLRRHIIARLLGLLYLLGHVGTAHMADMYLAPRCLGNLNHIHSGNHLRNHRPGIQKTLPVHTSFSFHPGFLPFNHGKIFAVEAGTSAKFLNPLHGFIGLPVV